MEIPGFERWSGYQKARVIIGGVLGCTRVVMHGGGKHPGGIRRRNRSKGLGCDGYLSGNEFCRFAGGPYFCSAQTDFPVPELAHQRYPRTVGEFRGPESRSRKTAGTIQ